jgi:hypothetical protein
MATEKQPERPEHGAHVEENHARMSKVWLDDSLVRQAVAEARARSHGQWPVTAAGAWLKQHFGKRPSE